MKKTAFSLSHDERARHTREKTRDYSHQVAHTKTSERTNTLSRAILSNSTPFTYHLRSQHTRMTDWTFKMRASSLFFTILAAHFLTHFAVTAQPDAEQPSIYINAGGSYYTDSDGNRWIADSYFNTGNTFSVSSTIANTSDTALYQSERWGPSWNDDLKYDIPLLNGNYNVVLHFAEVYMERSQARIFNITMEDQVVVDNLDIFHRVGGGTALRVPISTTVEDGSLTIRFDRVVENPKINAIEVHPAIEAVSSTPSSVPSQEPSKVGTAVAPSDDSQAPSWFPAVVVSMFPSLEPSSPPSRVRRSKARKVHFFLYARTYSDVALELFLT